MNSNLFSGFDQGLSTTIALLALFSADLTEIPNHFKSVETGLIAKKGKLKLLGLSLKALPWIAVAGAVWGFISAITSSEEAVEQTEDRLADLRGELEANRAAHQRNIDAIRRRNGVMQTAINMTRDLSEATERSVGQLGALQLLMNFLNSGTGDFSIALDAATGSLDENSESALANMIAYSEMNEAIDTSSVNIERMIERHQDLEQASDAVRGLELAHREANDVLDEACETKEELGVAVNDLYITMQHLTDEGVEVINMHFDAIAVYEEASAVVSDLEDQMVDYNEIIKDATTEIAILEGQITDSMVIMAEAVYDGTWRQIVSWDQLTDAQRDSITDLVDLYDWLRDGSVNALTKMGEETAVPLYQMINNLNHNYDETNAWGRNLARVYEWAGENATDGFMAFIEEMARDNPAQLAEIASSSDEQLGQLYAAYSRNAGQIEGVMSTAIGTELEEVQDLFNRFGPESEQSLRASIAAADFANPGGMMTREMARGILEASGEVESAITTLATSMRSSVDNVTAGFIGGIRASFPEVEQSSVQFGDVFIKAFRKTLQENSPSRVFERSGRNVVAGLVNGVRDDQDRATDTLRRLATAMERIFSQTSRSYQVIGLDTMRGLNQGLLNGEAQVMNTARRMANQITVAMRQALNINSPSRVMQEEIGRQIPAGVAEGIDKYGSYATDSMYDLGNELAKVKFPNINDIINMGPSLNLASVSNGGNSSHDNRVINNSYSGLFDGANITWNGEEDIRRTMEKMARAAEEDAYRMW
ncbi:MAG: hypothetical protein FWE07_03325 [Turicibacter sp.]|nr:hypothetical protein [Turicibacter sp.]